MLRTHLISRTCSKAAQSVTITSVQSLLCRAQSVFYGGNNEKDRANRACSNLANTRVGVATIRSLVTQPEAVSLPQPRGLVKHLPPWAQPYGQLARIDKPIGSWLLYAPCTWAIAMATPVGAHIDLETMALFGVGAFIMRGAGCTVNDMLDVDFDKNVRRTANRPLAAGIISQKQALGFLAVQLTGGLAVLLQCNPYSIVLGASSLVLVGTYPLMKRITNWPQAYLGLVFNWGALLGYSAVHGSCDFSVCLPLYLAGWSWTMIYDTVYAHQDRSDDILIGVKSTAVLMAGKTKLWLSGFGTVMASSLAIAGMNAGQGIPFFLGASSAMGSIAWWVYHTDLDSSDSCWNTFSKMKWSGFMIFAGALGNTLV